MIPIKIRLDTDDIDLRSLKLGLEGDAQIVLEERRDVILVPKRAVVRENQQAYVRLWKKGRLSKQTVVLGAFDGVNWEILEGLSEADIVALPKKQ